MDVVHWIPGNSRLSSSELIPQNMATTISIPTAARGVDISWARYQTAARGGDINGSDVYTRVAWVTASDWNVGVYSSHEVGNLCLVSLILLLILSRIFVYNK